jgi:hypothetical protein
MIKKKKFLHLARNYIDLLSVLNGHLEGIVDLICSTCVRDQDLADNISSFVAKVKSSQTPDRLMKSLEELDLKLDSVNDYHSMKFHEEEGFNNSFLNKEFIRSYIGTLNEFAEPIGNFSNTVLFRHINVSNRRISIINQKLPKPIQEKAKAIMINFSEDMYIFYESFYLSDRFETSIKDHITGFVKGKGYVDHAKSHLGCTSAISVDISKFYDSISLFGMISDALFYKSLSTSFTISTGLPFEPSSFDNPHQYNVLDNIFGLINMSFITMMNFYTHNGLLPTGANYSPVISNIIFSSMDIKIHKYCKDFGDVKYTRYADDICISSEKGYHDDKSFYLTMEHVLELEKVVNSSGFYLNYDKTKIMGPRDRKKIAGLIVDSSGSIPKLSIGSAKKLKLKQQYEGKSWNDLSNSDRGIVSWVKSINFAQYNFVVSGIEDVPEKLKAPNIIKERDEGGKYFLLSKHKLGPYSYSSERFRAMDCGEITKRYRPRPRGLRATSLTGSLDFDVEVPF